MSTANKLTYLNGTKQAIKQAINEDFEVIDNNTTFREYAEEISSNNAKYKDLIPKETKNATNTLDISNSSGLDKALVTQYGNTYQETNANVFDGTLAQTTYTGTGAVVENNPTRFNFINGYTYTINIKFTSNNVSTINQNRILGCRTYKDIGYTGRGVIISSDNLSSGTGSITFTAEENYNRFNFINYADFQSGTITITDFEIITNTPTPDYPQEIVNISGKSTLKDVGKNLFDGVLEIGNFNTNTGEKIANNDYIINTNPIPVEELTNYKISSNGTGIRMYVFEYKEDMTYNLSTRKTVNADSYLTTNSGTKYINFRTIDANTNLQEKIQVEKGSTVSTYEAYKEQSYDLDLKSKNLFDKNNANTINLYINNSTSKLVRTDEGTGCFYIPCEANTTYTVSKTELFGNDRFCVFDTARVPTAGDTVLSFVGSRSGVDTHTSYTITTTATATYLGVFVKAGTNPNKTLQEIAKTIQVEKNPTATEYEPFYDINLCKIGDYKDRIYPLNGKWYLEKKISKVVLNGSENWYKLNLTFRIDTDLFSDILSAELDNMAISNYFIYWKNTGGISTQLPNNNFGLTATKLIFNIRYNDIADVENFKTWLSTHNTEIYYVLETPTTTEITESNYPTLYNQLNNIKLFEGVNHITMTNESGLDVEFDIEYYKDWKLD